MLRGLSAAFRRSLDRDQQLRAQVLSNAHGPPQLRVDGVVRDIVACHAAFDVRPGDKLYLPQDERVRIW